MFDNQQLAQPAPAFSGAKHDARVRRQQGKLRQAAKIRELEKVLLMLGYKSAGQTAAAEEIDYWLFLTPNIRAVACRAT